MTDPAPLKLSKWPFYLVDLLLLAAAAWMVRQSPHALEPLSLVFVAACVMAGAWVCVTPYLVEYRLAMALSELKSLATVVEQIGCLKALASQIDASTAQWQGVQEHSMKTVATAKQISEQMAAEARAFSEFLQKANDQEKAHLRLEVEKFRRGEGEWLQVVVRLLDHVFGLHQAGIRSGQPNVIQQLGSFQAACRDVVRRMGLVQFEAQPDEPFSGERHQLMDPQSKPTAEARVAETLAAGFTFQGQILRPALVSIRTAQVEELKPTSDSQILFDEPG